MKIIRKRRFSEQTNFERVFSLEIDPGRMFGFPCDEKGEIDFNSLNEVAANNARRLLANEMLGYVDRGVITWNSRFTEPAVGLCEACGREVSLDGFTNTCDCGADYNSAGQRLAARSQWGEETGESLSDILMIE
jgi:hypothetical protein